MSRKECCSGGLHQQAVTNRLILPGFPRGPAALQSEVQVVAREVASKWIGEGDRREQAA